MTTFNKQGLKLAEEIKTNPEYNFIKKEVLIQFGFNPLILEGFVEWVSYSYMENFEEITGDVAQNVRRYTPEMIDLLTKPERQEIGIISEEDNPISNESNVIADEQSSSIHIIENRKRKERFAIMNKKDWFEIGQLLKEKRIELGISLTKMGQILKTSPSRIRNLENGKGVMMADHLKASYELVLELERKKQKKDENNVDQKDKQIKHIQVLGDGIKLITEAGKIIHIKVTQN